MATDTAIESATATRTGWLSVTVIVKPAVDGALGDPVMAPVAASRFNPAGREPEVTEKE